MASKPEGEGPPKPGASASMLSGAFAPGAAGGVKLPGQGAPTTGFATPMSMLQKLLGSNPAAQAAPATAPPLKPINPKRVEPISHPELAFSPSDIGVWEVNRERKGNSGTGGTGGRGWFS